MTLILFMRIHFSMPNRIVGGQKLHYHYIHGRRSKRQ